MAKDKTVVISDLHVDTWPGHTIDGKPKIDFFADFIEEVVEPEAATLVINGDILDAPPARGDILPTYEKVLNLIFKVASTTDIYYFVGNHDIGVWGLSISDYPLWGASKLNVIYPAEPRLYVQPKGSDGTVFLYFEHGHFFDPALGLYVAKVARQTYPVSLRLRSFIYRLLGLGRRSGKLLRRRGVTAGQLSRDVFRASQGRDSTGAKTKLPGLRPVQGRTLWTTLLDWLAGRPAEIYKEGHWRAAAQDVFEDLCGSYSAADVKAVVFGHTHVPDCAALSFVGKRALYINSGDWSAPSPSMGVYFDNSSFIVFDSLGNVIDKEGNIVTEPDKRAVRDFISERRAKGQGAQSVAPDAQAPQVDK